MTAISLPGEQSFDRSDARAAFAWCRAYARTRDENFTVVSWFLPQHIRPHFFSLYAFCRLTDDLGDEADGDRLALLDAWEREFEESLQSAGTRPLFVALSRTVQRFAIPKDLFLRLIEANRMDQRQTRFADDAELLHYCEHSAMPVGRMVLHVLGHREEQLLRLSDATCTGLQLANFWQDVSVDLLKGRIYVPAEHMRRFGVSEADLRAGRVTDAFRALMRFEVDWARRLFAEGRGLERLVERRVRTDVSLFRLGGEAVLDAIVAANYDVLTRRPRVSKARKLLLALSCGARLKLGV